MPPRAQPGLASAARGASRSLDCRLRLRSRLGHARRLRRLPTPPRLGRLAPPLAASAHPVAGSPPTMAASAPASRDPAAPASGPRAPAPSLAPALAPRDSAPSCVPLVASVLLDRLPSTATPPTRPLLRPYLAPPRPPDGSRGPASPCLGGLAPLVGVRPIAPPRGRVLRARPPTTGCAASRRPAAASVRTRPPYRPPRPAPAACRLLPAPDGWLRRLPAPPPAVFAHHPAGLAGPERPAPPLRVLRAGAPAPPRPAPPTRPPLLLASAACRLRPEPDGWLRRLPASPTTRPA
nr:vegetative cell wall protein gp1-like [Aegilops tauschii subsp. strangulata]